MILKRVGIGRLRGATGEYAAGNGAAMRVAPLAFCLDPDDDVQRRTLRDACFITHRHDEAYIGGLVVVCAIRAIVFQNLQLDADFLPMIANSLPDSRVRDQIFAIAALPINLSVTEVAQRFGNSASVAESVPLALYAARQISDRSFIEVIEQAVAAGGDTDTIASIAGQVAGSYVGLEGIPQEYINRLPKSEAIDETVKRFAVAVTGALEPCGRLPYNHIVKPRESQSFNGHIQRGFNLLCAEKNFRSTELWLKDSDWGCFAFCLSWR